MPGWLLALLIVLGLLVLVALYDVLQRRRAILRNFPVIGHLRYILEKFGPELRQYIVTSNNEERPFSRDQRRWVYASAKGQNPYFGFGSDNPSRVTDEPVFRHAAFPRNDPIPPDAPIPSAKVLGTWRDRPGAFRPASVVNISAMSYGSLSAPAVAALNGGARQAGCLHNTGEGGIADCHRQGGELVFQVGTGYFGCRDKTGAFSLDRLVETVASAPVRAIEIKLSQGAKPGLGGLLPGAKVTSHIAAARGVPVGVTVASPAAHREFGDVDGLVDFVERIASATGIPVGIKSAVGERRFWVDLAATMAHRHAGPDFITIDGGEGGTGAGPMLFTDHVALPFREAFTQVHQVFTTAGLDDDVVFIGSGKLGLGADAMVAFALGADMINVGRAPMLAAGCIQAQKCHTGHCPTGVATQSAWLSRGLDPTSKAVRVGRYLMALRTDLLRLSHAMGEDHPATVASEHVEVYNDAGVPIPVNERYRPRDRVHE